MQEQRWWSRAAGPTNRSSTSRQAITPQQTLPPPWSVQSLPHKAGGLTRPGQSRSRSLSLAGGAGPEGRQGRGKPRCRRQSEAAWVRSAAAAVRSAASGLAGAGCWHAPWKLPARAGRGTRWRSRWKRLPSQASSRAGVMSPAQHRTLPPAARGGCREATVAECQAGSTQRPCAVAAAERHIGSDRGRAPAADEPPVIFARTHRIDQSLPVGEAGRALHGPCAGDSAGRAVRPNRDNQSSEAKKQRRRGRQAPATRTASGTNFASVGTGVATQESDQTKFAPDAKPGRRPCAH